MQRDSYGLLVQALVATAILGSAVRYDKVYLFHVVLGLALLRSLLVATPGTLFWPQRLPSRYHYFFAFLLGWFALGMAWSIDRTATLRYLGYLGIAVALMLTILKYVGCSRLRLQQVVGVGAFFLLLDIAVGLVEAFTSWHLPTSPLASSSEMMRSLGPVSNEAFALLKTMPTGFHGNPNNFAVVMVGLLPFFVLHRWLSVRAAGAAVVFLLIYYASSRGALIGAACVVCLVPVYERSAVGRLLLLGGFGVAGLLVSIGTFHALTKNNSTRFQELMAVTDVLKEYLFDDGIQRRSAGKIRRQMIVNAMNALWESRGLGIGGGGDRIIQCRMGMHAEADRAATHNFWVEMLVNGGFPFFVPFVIWYVRIAWELFLRGHRMRGDPATAYYCRATSLAMVGFVPAAISASSAIYLLPFYVLLGIALALIGVSRGQGALEAARLRSFAVQRRQSIAPYAPFVRAGLAAPSATQTVLTAPRCLGAISRRKS